MKGERQTRQITFVSVILLKHARLSNGKRLCMYQFVGSVALVTHSLSGSDA